MTTTRFVRGSNSRMLAYLSALLLLTATIFLYHNARVEVDAEKEALTKCQQTQESLSAQLQVIFEYKVRLEKNLNEERNRHQETKDKLQTHLNDEQEKNKENQEAVNKFTALQQQYRLLNTRHEDLRGEYSKATRKCETQYKALEQKAAVDMDKLKNRNMQLQDEADDYRKQLIDFQNESKRSDGQADRFKRENLQLKKENDNLKAQIENLEKRLKGISSSTDRGGAVVGANGGRGGGLIGPDTGALAAPNQGRAHSPSSSTPTPDGRQGMNDVIANQLAASNSKALGKQSTTPQINPEALLSQEKAAHGGVVAPPVAPAPPSLRSSQGPKQSAQQLLKSKERLHEEAQQQQVGVLPIPFAFQDNQQSGLPVVPAVVPALAPPQHVVPQQHVVPLQSHEVPSNQGQQPPLDDGGFGNGFNAAIPAPRNFAAQKEQEDWMSAFRQPMGNERRAPVAAPMDSRPREDRLKDWARQEAPFQDYDKDMHAGENAGENEEDDDDDAADGQMDNAVNQAPESKKKFGANKIFGRNNIMVNPR